MIRFGYAFSSGFFTLYAWTRRKLYEIQWFRGEGIRAFTIPFGEFRLTLDGQLKARDVAMDEAARGGDSTWQGLQMARTRVRGDGSDDQ